MVVERLEGLNELVILVELELLFYFIGILEIIKSWDGLFVQDYKYWSKGCNSTTFPSYLWYLLYLDMNKIGCRLVALLT